MIKPYIFLVFLISSFAFAQTTQKAAKGDSQKFMPKESQKEIELQWDEFPGAIQYNLEILNLKHKVIQIEKSKTPVFKFKISYGKYFLRGYVTTKEGVDSTRSKEIPLQITAPTDKSSAKKTAKYAKNKNDLVETEISWPQDIEAKKYHVQVISQTNKVVVDIQTKDFIALIKLPTGIYSYQVSSIFEDNSESPPILYSDAINIALPKLPLPEIDKNISSASRIQWNLLYNSQIYAKVEYTQHFINDWKTLSEQTLIDNNYFASDLTPGHYRLTYFARAEGWLDSDKQQIEFDAKPDEQIINKSLQLLH